MIGAMAGDIIGSVFEWNPVKTTDFPLFSPRSRFTDDSVLTAAVALAIMTDGDYAASIKRLGRRHADAGYGGRFQQWLHAQSNLPYNSWGNGAAMRVGPVGFAFDTVAQVLLEAKRSAEITHNHPEGIKGAQAVALAVFLARSGKNKHNIQNQVRQRFGYDLNRRLAEIRPGYGFDVSCQGSVPEAIIAFLEADSVEDAIRNAVSLGGDSDTMACIAGCIAHAFYRSIPKHISSQTKNILAPDLRDILRKFCRTYAINC